MNEEILTRKEALCDRFPQINPGAMIIVPPIDLLLILGVETIIDAASFHEVEVWLNKENTYISYLILLLLLR